MSYSEIIINGSPVKLIPLGYCICGCGQKTRIATANNWRRSQVKGLPVRLISGHNGRGNKRENSTNWKGGQHIDSKGYACVRVPEHPRAQNGYVREHILRAEKALGKPLPEGAAIHHANGSKIDGPLVICQDDNYHKTLHRRTRALKACGHAHWRKCWLCQNYDSPENLIVPKSPRQTPFHKDCAREYRRKMGRKSGAEPDKLRAVAGKDDKHSGLS